MSQIAQHLLQVKERIVEAARRVGRGADHIQLLAVSKTKPLVDIQAAYAAGPGLCLPHFRRALAGARHDAQITALVQTQLRVWRALHADLTEYIRLQDYRFRDEPRGPEQRAPGQAIETIAGAPGAATRTNPSDE